ncbi:hypothetical protein [Salibacter halophilus]|uniref:Uncharacterized protein n=1 Tax=Salibacter halophilus TaxID=1803916 RepID=A0A6N6M709_9FLAO|nr:hypothetical protein [Salibacter halophilus]KAB1064300.1 hypothetical protein F3059_06255 [Salibacter halophilus]
MKFISSILLIALFGFTQFFNAVLFVNYRMNVDEITELFCENKDKPELNCNGKCHFSQQLMGETDEKRAPQEISFLPEQTLYFGSDCEEFSSGSDQNKNSSNFFYQISYSFLAPIEVFHPPRA